MRKIRAFKRREKCNAIIVSNLLGKETDRKQIAAAVPNDHTTQMLALPSCLTTSAEYSLILPSTSAICSSLGREMPVSQG